MTVTDSLTTGSIRTSDVDIFYRRFGRTGRTPVLIAHGLSYFSYDWIGPASAIAVDREVVAFDMRGFGNSGSSPTRNYKLETLADDVTSILDHLGWERVVLMGHSFGGRVCLATAGWKPQRAAALILIDFAPDIAPEGRRHTAERIGLQPDNFVSVDEALAFHGHTDVPADSSLRRRYEAFLRTTDAGYTLRRDLYFRDNFQCSIAVWPLGAGSRLSLANAGRAHRSDPGHPCCTVRHVCSGNIAQGSQHKSTHRRARTRRQSRPCQRQSARLGRCRPQVCPRE